MLHRLAISAPSLWGGRCSTGGRPTGGSAVQSHAYAPASPSRTWSPTHCRRRCCAAPETHSLTPPRMAVLWPTSGLAFSCSRCRRGPGYRLLPDRQPDPLPGTSALTFKFRLVGGSSHLGPGRAGPAGPGQQSRLRHPFRQQVYESQWP